jgi:hypothetical protein
VYWLQQPGGSIFTRTAGGYEVAIEGPPSLFKERASIALGQSIEIMFNDQPAGPLESLTVMADENGRPSMVLAKHGNAISFSVLNVGTAFRSRASVNLKGGKEDRVGEALATDRATITTNNDKSTATINLVR